LLDESNEFDGGVQVIAWVKKKMAEIYVLYVYNPIEPASMEIFDERP